MKILFLITFNSLVFVFGKDCTSQSDIRNAFGDYLKCIKSNLDHSYGEFESEIKEDTRRSVKTCFAQSIDEGNQRGTCVLAVSDLELTAWDRNGPLRDCSVCRTFAAGAIKAVLSTPPDEQKCIRTEIAKAVVKEANHCIRKKIADFAGFPEIPDLEEGSYAFKENVIQSVSDYILIRSRLAFCNDRKASRATSTKACLKNPFPGYFSKHCEAIRSCEQKNACGDRIREAKKATCKCIGSTQEELKVRIASIADTIKTIVEESSRGAALIGTGSKVETCVAGIKSKMTTEVNNWVEVIDSALSRCIRNKPSGQSLGLDSLLNVGCRKVVADTTGTASGQLKTGFDFINNLVDAMVDRSVRFCGGDYCVQ